MALSNYNDDDSNEVEILSGGLLKIIDQTTRKLLLVLIKSGFKLRYGNTLIDETLHGCGWNVDTFAHDTNGSAVPLDDLLSKKDTITFGINLQGNRKIAPNTCAVAFSAANDKSDADLTKNLMRHIGSAGDALEPHQIDSIRGNFTTLVSGQSHDIYRPAWKEYQQVTLASAYHNWLSLANSSECHHLLSTGYSLGGLLSQIHRIDVGDVNALGEYTGTCLGGKPCRLIAIRPIGGFWFGRVPKFHECTDNAMAIVLEHDMVAIWLPLVYQNLNQPVRYSLRDAGIYSFVDIENIQIEWRIRNQYLKDGRFKPQVMSFQVPRTMPFLNFTSSAVYRDRQSYINSWGPLVSRTICFTPVLSAKFCTHANLLNFFFDASMLEDEKLGKFWGEYNFDLGIPDLSGSAFNTIIR